jgi:hypothetical protein
LQKYWHVKRYKPAQIVTLLRQIEMEIANGKTTPQVCKEAEITVQTYYRWRKEFCGLKHALEASAKLSVDEFSFRGQHFDMGW